MQLLPEGLYSGLQLLDEVTCVTISYRRGTLMSSSWYKSGNIIHTWSLLYISKLSRMSLNFGDISGVELREKPRDESDLEDDLDLDFI